MSVAESNSVVRSGPAWRLDRDGWIELHIEGTPYERGCQHGWLLAAEIRDALRSIADLLWLDTATPFSWWAANARAMWFDRLSRNGGGNPADDATQQIFEELSGIVDGVNANGRGSQATISIDEVLGWNGYPEMICQWFPEVLAGRLKPLVPLPSQCPAPGASSAGLPMMRSPHQLWTRHHCSAFISTGEWTADGQILAAHTTWQRFANGDHYNVVAHIQPPAGEGYAVTMQTAPGYVASSMDFGQNAAGIVAASTSIGASGFLQDALPYFVRARRAGQRAHTIETWIELFRAGNNGGYANTWLLGEASTARIAAYEITATHEETQGPIDSGAFASCNIPLSKVICIQDTGGSNYDNVLHSGARRVRFGQLLDEHKGCIDAGMAKTMLADHHDVYTGADVASARTICGHCDTDDDRHNTGHGPFYPWGSLDGKVTTAALVRNGLFEARWGRACGTPFEAGPFFRRHPQYGDFRPLTRDRPTQPWVVFPTKPR